MAGALAYAWETFQLLHRDIKPANIMVDSRQRVFLMDLGLAKSMAEESGMTLSGTILGTPLYMSPEQALGRSDLGVASDVYSLGATLYHLATGGPPFPGDSALTILNQHVRSPLPPPRERNPDLGAACACLIERMMAKKPEDRYGDWRALLADLDRARAGEVLAHGPDHTVAGRKPSLLVLGIAAAAVLLLVLLVALAMRARTSRSDRAAGTEPPPPAATVPPATPPAETATETPKPKSAARKSEANQPVALPAPETTPAVATETPQPVAEPVVPVVEPAVPVADPAVAAVEPAVPVVEETIPDPAIAALAKDVLAGQTEAALGRWRENRDALGAGLAAEQREAVTAQLAAVAGVDEQILSSFQAEIGKTVAVELVGGRTACEIREVGAAGVQVMQAIRQGQTVGRVGRILRPADLTVAERLRRLGTDETPERDLQRGMLALEAGRTDIARKLFAKAGSPLGEKLAVAVEERQAKAKEEAAERAVAELLREVSTSPRLGKREQVIAGIRRRCGDDLRRVQRARKVLADFEREWGNTEAGKEWVPVVRDALTYLWTGEDWTVPEIGMEFVWIKPLKMWVGKYETTNGEYRKKEPRHDSKEYRGHSLNGDRQPVVFVNWDDAVAYAAWLTERERAAGRLPDGLRYRLPTEDEFLAYAQCGSGREYPWGRNWPPRSGQAGNYSGQESVLEKKIPGYNDGHPVTCDVEKSWANPWGLYGVGGNVWEICAEDTAMKQSFGAWRGASWNYDYLDYLRCAYRDDFDASYRDDGDGFRLVLSR